MRQKRSQSAKLLRSSDGEIVLPRSSVNRRALMVSVMSAMVFVVIIGRLVSFGVSGVPIEQLSMVRALSTSLARPDIVDRNGRLLATDISMPSLFADPQRIIDVDEVAEKLAQTLGRMNAGQYRAKLSNRNRRFVWLKRGISPALAQKVHNLGLPGLGFRDELKRIYPAGQLAGHILGIVNVDNRGMSGIERYIDEVVGVALVKGALGRDPDPVRLSLDLKVQYALRQELHDAQRRYGAKAVAGVVLDANNGEVIAMSSLPDFDPNRPGGSLKKDNLDRMTQGTYELGSVFKALTVALVLDSGVGNLSSKYDARRKIKTGIHEINDFHGRKRMLSLREVFLYSSNIGAAHMGTDLGRSRLTGRFKQLGLMTPLKTEIGRGAQPRLPKHWGEVEVMTSAFGHGLAVTPLQFAAASLPLVNGGFYRRPRFVLDDDRSPAAVNGRVLKSKTSDLMRRLMRDNVSGKGGTGRRAGAVGYNVGGKTGTAEMPGRGGYDKHRVISSFIGAFPMDAPRYVTYMVLFEPQPRPETKGKITAGLNAAPATARLISRIGPLLRQLPRS